jgi:hypothetical protein
VFIGQSFDIEIYPSATPTTSVDLIITVNNGATVTPAILTFTSEQMQTVKIQPAVNSDTSSITISYTTAGLDQYLYSVPLNKVITVTPLGIITVTGIPSSITAGERMNFVVSVTESPHWFLSIGVTPVINGIPLAVERSTVNFFHSVTSVASSISVPISSSGTVTFLLEVGGVDCPFYLLPILSPVIIVAG